MFRRSLVRIIELKSSSVQLSTLEPKAVMQDQIRIKLEKSFKPIHLEIINESSKHNVPKGSETHFKLVVVSDSFENSTPIERHRKVNELLKEEFDSGLHALSIVAKTPDQWHSGGKNVNKSPPCLGGSAR